MYDFKSLQSIYSICIRHRLPDYTEYEYKSKVAIEAKKEKNKFLFTITERFGVRLNNAEPEKIMDQLMMQLGDSLYPLELIVSPEGELISVHNFEEVNKEWNKKAEELLKNNPTRAFKNYLEMSKKNFINENKFKESLLKDTFIQLYFQSCEKKTIEIDCFNFPKQNKKTTYLAGKREDTSTCYDLIPVFLEKDLKGARGSLEYKLFRTGEIEQVEADFYLLTPETGIYKKSVTIESDTEQHRVKTGFFF